MNRRAQAFGLLAVVLALAACRADAHVDIVVEPDGRGRIDVEVTLDEELLGVIGGTDALGRAAAGLGPEWEVSVGGRGAAVVELGREFGSIGELIVALDDLEDAGLFRSGSLRAVDERDLRTWTLLLELDLGVEPVDFADPELTEVLDDRPFGLSEAEMRELLDGDDAGLGLSVAMDLPGEHSGASTGVTVDEEGIAAWSGAIGDGARVQVSASSRVVDTEAIGLRDQASERRGVALLVVVSAAALGAVIWLISHRRRPRPTSAAPPAGPSHDDDIVVVTGTTDLADGS